MYRPNRDFEWAYDIARELGKQVEEIVRTVVGKAPRILETLGTTEPRTEMYETDEELVVRFELPGVDPKDVELLVREGRLILRGEMKQEEETRSGSCYYSERRYGKFYREVLLPVPVEADKAKAKYKNGILEVRIPKSTGAKGRKIEIEEG